MSERALVIADDLADKSTQGRLRSRVLLDSALELSEKLDLDSHFVFVTAKNSTASIDNFSAIKKAYEKNHRSVSVNTVNGNVVIEILKATQSYPHAAFLLMGTQTKRPFRKMLIGNIAEEILRLSTLPTILIGPIAQKERNSVHLSSRTRILLLTDFGDASRQAELVSETFAQILNCTIVVIHSVGAEIYKISKSLKNSGHIPFNIDKMFNQMTEDAQRQLHAFTQRWQARGLRAEYHLVEKEEALEKSLKQLISKSCDFIIMGAHGPDQKISSILGSNTRHLIMTSPWPVLVAKESKNYLFTKGAT